MADWEKAIAFVLKWEGGYVPPSAKDPGGETKYGISKKAHPTLDIKNLDKNFAIAIYNEDYWIAAGCPLIRDDAMALAVFDTAVNCGTGRAQHWLNLSRGDVGLFIEQREIYYKRLAKSQIYSRYLKGWMNRLNDLRKEVGL